MSPEQARGEDVSARSDVFGLGALLCEILTGKPPYEGPDQKRVHARAMSGKIEKAYLCLDKCNRDNHLVDLAKNCLAPQPSDRPKSAAEVAAAINSYLESALDQAESDICRFFDLTLDLFCIATMGTLRELTLTFPKF
jgi:serine/threonine-protein kinase